ncbi:MAG: hypothetical protein ACTSVI_15535 [Promethearchaeota archaeon]
MLASTSANATILGAQTSYYLGQSAAGLGDINGDGYDDFAITGPMADGVEAPVCSGRVFIYFGSPTTLTGTYNLPSKADASLKGSFPYEDLGYKIAAAGDVNGDNISDFLVTSYNEFSSGGERYGRVYLVFGRTSGWGYNSYITTFANASFLTKGDGNENDLVGKALAGADINGDGYSDFMIGAPGMFNSLGRVYLFYGKASGWAMNTVLSNTDATFFGRNGGSTVDSNLGGAITPCGDFNKDGFEDFAVSAEGGQGATVNSGLIFIIFGRPEPFTGSRSIFKDPYAIFYGESGGVRAENALAGGSDLDNNGYPDLVIGNSRYSSSTGKTYVLLTSGPPFTRPVPDMIVAQGASGETIPWNITDPNDTNGTYSVFVNNFPNGSGVWINNTLINYPINTNWVGTFTYLIVYTDGYSQTSDAIEVRVTSTTPPSANDVADFAVPLGATGENITWNITDPGDIGTYVVLKDGVIYSSGSWTSGIQFNVSVDVQTTGIFNYTLRYTDGINYGTEVTTMVSVNAAPTITNPPDQVVGENIVASIPWNISDTDNASGSYEIFRNGTSIQNGTWTSGVPINASIDTSIIGDFNYTILYGDGISNGTPDTVIISVNAVPTINNPQDQVVGENTAASLSWAITDTDNASGSYEIFRNGTSIQNGTWTSGVLINISIDTSIIGDILFIINYSDGINDGTPDNVIISVNAKPAAKTPSSVINVNQGDENSWLWWNITDSDNDSGIYCVLINGTEIDSGVWTPGVALNYLINTSIVGTFEYEMQYDDGINAKQSSIIVVNIIQKNNNPSNDMTYLWILIPIIAVGGVFGVMMLIKKEIIKVPKKAKR